MGRHTPEVVAEALAAGDIDKASAFLWAETHHQLASARQDGLDGPALLDDVAKNVLHCLPPGLHTTNVRLLARLVARLAVTPFPESEHGRAN